MQAVRYLGSYQVNSEFHRASGCLGPWGPKPFVYIHIYIYISDLWRSMYVCIDVSISIYAYVPVHMWIHVCVYTCVRVHMYTYILHPRVFNFAEAAMGGTGWSRSPELSFPAGVVGFALLLYLEAQDSYNQTRTVLATP